jgi:hypothetical protein
MLNAIETCSPNNLYFIGKAWLKVHDKKRMAPRNISTSTFK